MRHDIRLSSQGKLGCVLFRPITYSAEKGNIAEMRYKLNFSFCKLLWLNFPYIIRIFHPRSKNWKGSCACLDERWRCYHLTDVISNLNPNSINIIFNIAQIKLDLHIPNHNHLLLQWSDTLHYVFFVGFLLPLKTMMVLVGVGRWGVVVEKRKPA